MLKPQRHCACCGTEMESIRSTKSYCSDGCRKKAARGGTEQQAESRWIVECLRRVGCIGQVWPVYPWDDSPQILALMVSRQSALDQLNLGSTLVVTEADLTRALKDFEIADTDCGKRLEAAIRDFYKARKERHFRKG